MEKRATKLEQRAASYESRESKIKLERERYAIRSRNKKIFNYTIVSLLIIAILFAFYLKFNSASGINDTLAQCLTQKGVVMYGTEWCQHCQEQKQLFGQSFIYVNFVNCDLNPNACTAAGVEGFPTWVFTDGPSVSGKQSLEYLAKRSGCLV